MTTDPPTDDRKPRIMLVWFDPAILAMLHEVLTLEGYRITATQSARRALDRIQRSSHPYVVLMDNFHLRDEICAFAAEVFATPELHQRVRVIGVAIQYDAHLIALDAFIAMPFSVDGLLDPIAAACADLRAAVSHP
jgi:CheY-like chemotaxis protein